MIRDKALFWDKALGRVIAMLIAVTFFMSAFGAAIVISDYHNRVDPSLAGSTVKILVGEVDPLGHQGHGSGVHIGDGLFLTAAHVAAVGKPTIVTDTREKHDAEVLWSNEGYDVALLALAKRVERPAAASKMSCGVPAIGQSVWAKGSPFDIDFVTTWGKVTSGVIAYRAPVWREIVVADLTAGPGMSGGPLFDAANRVVGIVVGGFPTAAFSLIVPGSTLCHVMGRVAPRDA